METSAVALFRKEFGGSLSHKYMVTTNYLPAGTSLVASLVSVVHLLLAARQ